MASKIEMLVAARCVTYNQREYIKDTLNGFTMQKTTFPYICIIIDDASTDGEQEVIDAYLREHFDMENNEVSYVREDEDAIYKYAQHLQNKNCYFIVLELKKNLYHDVEKKRRLFAPWLESVKYNALCEGDDYWTDPLKLQKQVVFLEEHPDYSMCFHAADVKIEGVDIKHKGAHCEVIEDRDYTSTEMFSTWIVPTASIVYNKSLYDSFSIRHKEWLTRGDIVTVLTCAHVGKVRGISDKMSVYRMQPNSVSHNPAIRGKEIYRLANHFRCLYINFPTLEKAPVTWCISNAYYGRMKAPKRNPFQRFGDFILFFYWNPRYAIQKLLSLYKTKIIRK